MIGYAEVPEAVLDQAGLWLDDWHDELPRLLLRSRLEGAEAALDPASALRVRLRLWRAALDGRHDRIEVLAREAWRRDDPALHADAANLLYQCLPGPDAAGRRRELAARLVGTGLRAGRPVDVLLGLLWGCVERFRAGEPTATALRDLRSALAHQHHPRISLLADRLTATSGLRSGIPGTGGEPPHDLARRWYEGRIADARPAPAGPSSFAGPASLGSPADEIAAGEHGRLALAALALTAAAGGDTRQAEAALARLSGSSDLAALYLGVEAAAVLGDRDFAAEAYERLQPCAHLPMTAPLEGVCFGSAQQALGVAAVVLGDHPRAIEHLTAAVRANLTLGHWPALVFTRARLARCWLLHDPRGGAAHAHRELRLAARDAAGLAVSVPGPGGFPLATGAWQPASEAASPDRLVVRRRGATWEVVLGWRHLTVADTRGLGYLAVLAANPGKEIRAADLAAGPGERAAPDRVSVQPVLDEAAARAYRERLTQLRNQARRAGPGAERIRTEMEWLRAELAATSGPGGRRRAFADQDERARIAVGKAIRRAIDQLTRIDPVVGRYVRTVVRTGVRCVFEPL